MAKLVSVSWKSMGSGSPSRASRAARWSEGSSIQASPVWVEKNTSGPTLTKAGIVFNRPALNVFDLLGEPKLAIHPLFARSTFDFFAVHVVLQTPVESKFHGTVHAAFRPGCCSLCTIASTESSSTVT